MKTASLDGYSKSELAKLCGVSLVTINAWRRSGFLPEPAKLGGRRLHWPTAVIQAWLQARGLL